LDSDTHTPFHHYSVAQPVLQVTPCKQHNTMTFIDLQYSPTQCDDAVIHPTTSHHISPHPSHKCYIRTIKSMSAVVLCTACFTLCAALPCPALLSRQAKRHQEEADGHKAAAVELQRGLTALTSQPQASALQKELGDTVRRMAVVQVCVGARARTCVCSAEDWDDRAVALVCVHVR
jgi:hypothetical protein